MKKPQTVLTRLARMTCSVSLALAATLSHAQVGMRQMTSGNMPITVVYPTAAPVQPIIHGPFTMQAAPDAAPLPAPPASRRLIVLSHGTAGSTDNDHDLAATLALLAEEVGAGLVAAPSGPRGAPDGAVRSAETREFEATR